MIDFENEDWEDDEIKNQPAIIVTAYGGTHHTPPIQLRLRGGKFTGKQFHQFRETVCPDHECVCDVRQMKTYELSQEAWERIAGDGLSAEVDYLFGA